MAKANALLQILINTIKEAAFYNTNRLEEILVNDYPFPASREFIEALVRLHKELLERVDLLEKELLADGEFEAQIIRVQRYGQLFSELHMLLQILEMGGRQYVPQFVAALIGSILNSFNKGAKYIFLPGYEYNYAYLEIINPLKTALRDAISDTEKTFGFTDKLAIFWFPLAHKDNMLLNSLLAHELGHFINDEKKITEALIDGIDIPTIEIDKIAVEWLKVKLVKFKAEKKEIKIDDYVGLETAKAQMKKSVVSRLSVQLKELISDAIGFCLFGPTFLLAQNNFLTTLSTLEYKPEGYPSVRMRIEFLLDLLVDMGYLEALEEKRERGIPVHQKEAREFIEIIEALGNVIKQSPRADQDTEDVLSYRIMEDVLIHRIINGLKKDLWTRVHAAVKEQEYTAERFKNDVFKLTDTISCFVPPVEIDVGQPANPISILNAGMLYELTQMEDMHEVMNDESLEDRLNTRHKLHRLVMKAGELSQAQTLLQDEMKKSKAEKKRS